MDFPLERVEFRMGRLVCEIKTMPKTMPKKFYQTKFKIRDTLEFKAILFSLGQLMMYL